MSVISDLWSAYQKLGRDDVSAWVKVEGFAGSICQIFGLPVKNIMRDVRSAFQAYNTIVHGEDTTATGIKYAVKEAITGKSTSNVDQLYEARLAGDDAHTARVEGRYDDEDSADAAVRQAIKNRYLDGELTSSEAYEQLLLHANATSTDINWMIDKWNYIRETGSDDGYSKFNKFYEAVETGKDLKATIKMYTDSDVERSTLSSQLTNHFNPEYIEMTTAQRANIKGYIINAKMALGYTEDEARDMFVEWDIEAKYGEPYDDIVRGFKDGTVDETTMRNVLADKGYNKSDIEDKISDWMVNRTYGYDYSKLDDAYRAGNLSREDFRQAMIDNGTFPEKADQAIVTYDWMRDNAQYGLEYSDAYKYAHPIQNYGYSLDDVGLSPDTYLEYKELKKECKGVDADKDGKADDGTKRDSIFAMIDSLPISNDQKDALAAIDYGMKSIKKNAPWH